MPGDQPQSTAQRAGALLPWVQVAFWIGAVGLALKVASPAVVRLTQASDLPGVLDALNAGLMAALPVGPAIALLWGLAAAGAFVRSVAAGGAVDSAAVRALRDIGDACVTAAVLAILVVPVVTGWVTGEGRFVPRLDAFFLALLGLGLVLGIVARVVADSAAQAAAAKAELEQIV